MYFNFAWRYFKAKKSANAINIIAWVTTGVIAFATCCQILVLSVFNGFEDLVHSLYSSFYADIKVHPASGKTFLLTSKQIATLSKYPNIAAITMIAEEKALLKNNDEQVVISLKGVDQYFKSVSGVPTAVSNGTFDVGTKDDPKLVVGSGIQNAAGIVLDAALAPQQLTLILPKKDAPGSDPQELLSEGNVTASGIFTIQQEFDNNYALTNIDFVKQQINFKPQEYSAAEIKLIAGTDMNKSRELLQNFLGSQFLVQTKYEHNNSLYNTMRLEKWAIYAILTLILIIAAFNMISALTMLVLEKKNDIQVLQSMGANQSQIRKIFLSEGLLLGGIGSATGITLAIIICLLQLKFKLIKLGGGAFLIDYFPVKLIIWDFLMVAATAAAITLIASWIPANKASKQPLLIR